MSHHHPPGSPRWKPGRFLLRISNGAGGPRYITAGQAAGDPVTAEHLMWLPGDCQGWEFSAAENGDWTIRSLSSPKLFIGYNALNPNEPLVMSENPRPFNMMFHPLVAEDRPLRWMIELRTKETDAGWFVSPVVPQSSLFLQRFNARSLLPEIDSAVAGIHEVLHLDPEAFSG